MTKYVINKCFGGFDISEEGFEFLIKKGWKVTEFDENGHIKDENARIWKNKDPNGLSGKYFFDDKYDLENRKHPDLIEMVETLKEKASGRFGQLEIVEIPDDVKEPYLDDYDGIETIREGRSW